MILFEARQCDNDDGDVDATTAGSVRVHVACCTYVRMSMYLKILCAHSWKLCSSSGSSIQNYIYYRRSSPHPHAADCLFMLTCERRVELITRTRAHSHTLAKSKLVIRRHSRRLRQRQRCAMAVGRAAETRTLSLSVINSIVVVWAVYSAANNSPTHQRT